MSEASEPSNLHTVSFSTHCRHYGNFPNSELFVLGQSSRQREKTELLVSPKDIQAWRERRELLEARLRDADDLEPRAVTALQQELAQILRILANADRH